MAGNGYQALVFGPETTNRRSVLEKAVRLAESGGCVIFFGRLPTGSTEAGRNDPEVAKLLERLLGRLPTADKRPASITRSLSGGGFAAFLPSDSRLLVRLVAANIDRDFEPVGGQRVFVSHRRIGEVDVYLVQNPAEGTSLDLHARCRVDGVPELWDPFTGEVRPVDRFERKGKVTEIWHRLEGNTAYLFVFRPGGKRSGASLARLLQPDGLERPLPEDWTFSVIPTRDNRWGEFRWPPSDEVIGPEVRSFRYAEEPAQAGVEQGWQQPGFDDSRWQQARYSIGPYWLALHPVPEHADAAKQILPKLDEAAPGSAIEVGGKRLPWRPVEFSKTIGLARPAPWGGHSGYPDGAIDQNFIELPKGRKLLFTRIRSPKDQRLGLRIELRQTKARLWVNGVEQPIEDAVGNLPLRAGINTVLIDLPDGGRGRLFVQRQPPSAATLAEAARGAVRPDLGEAFWIRAGHSGSGYVRRAFHLDRAPKNAKVIVTAYTGYRLFVNGVKVEEEIGPWARWTRPESINITPHLRKGTNVLAAWVQVHSGLHFHGDPDKQAFALSLKVQFPDGQTMTLVSDGSWKGSVEERDGWETVEFDDSAWQPVVVLARMGEPPWGDEPLKNVGLVTEPRRKRSVDLPSPYLTCFEEVPEIVYDVKPPSAKRVGWYRFDAPPGLRALHLRTAAPARVWVDGVEVPVRDGVARVPKPPAGVSKVAIRLEMQPGSYGGAAFPLPIGLELGGGTIQPGLWADFALPTYSGIGVYRQTLTLTAEEAERPTELDLGKVLVAAEVLVNGKRAGVRLARPFKFDLTGLLHEGKNTLEVRVANTIAPHYTVTNRVNNLGPTDSGLLGPVVLRQRLPLAAWRRWAKEEIARLRRTLGTSTPELQAAQKKWEQQTHWQPLKPTDIASPSGLTLRKTSDDGWLESNGVSPQPGIKCSLHIPTDMTGITGFRLEVVQRRSADAGRSGAEAAGPSIKLKEFRMTAALPENRRFRGRRIRIQIIGRTEYLHLAEVQVFSQGKNIARQGRARQSSSSWQAPARLAIDGNTSGLWSDRSVCHTKREHEPWWELDLGSTQPIDRIVIWNRTDGGLQTRLVPCRVSVLDEAGRVVWQRVITDPPDPQVELHLSPVPVVFRNAPTELRPTRALAAAGDAGADRRRAAKKGAKRSQQRLVALFETTNPVGFKQGTILTVNLTLSADRGAVIERIR
ncbi:MAG: hypothetical protein GXP27_19920, partial [Planctomycetes bacterium]|nr:hypothetical protein [Planctomycetota bacterium]